MTSKTDLTKIIDQPPKRVDTGLLGLVCIAGLHHIPADPEALKHKYSPMVAIPGEDVYFGPQELILAAKKELGYRAKAVKVTLKMLDNSILPLLGKDSSNDFFVLLKIEEPQKQKFTAGQSVDKNENRYIIGKFEPNKVPNPTLLSLSAEEISTFWDGEAILLSPRRSPLTRILETFNLKWFIASILKYQRFFMGVLIASFLIQALGLVTPLFFQVVMDKVLLHQALTTLDVLAIGFLAAATFEVAFTMARNYLFNHTTTRVDVELASKLFSRLFSLPLSWFQARQTGQTVARLRELDTLRHFITSSALTVSLDLVFTLIYLIVMYFYSPTLLLVVILSFPIYIIITIIITPILRRRLNNKFEYGAAIQSLSVECINGAETVKGQAIEHQMQRKWEDLQANYALASFRAVQLAQNTSQIFGFVQKATTLLIIWLGASEVMEGDMTVGQLIAFNMLAGRISGPIIKIAQFWQDFQQAGISLNRLGDILNSPIESGFEVGRSSLPALTGRILFEHANFKYRFDSPLVLDDINIEILPGEIIGLAGRSGSGKSTLTKIVQNMYPLSGGRVMVDGVDLSMINNSWLRANIGVVSQESYLFSGSIRDNIALRDQAIPMERIMRAAIIAGAHNFIMSFPEGYETKVGENGSNLSGGQKQRLALARILIGDPKILILDEATSALDYESERIIQDNMSVICKGRTVIIIAHRLSALRSATRIIVLDKGRLVENGTPKQLMEKRGFYYNMATSQNQSN